MDSPSETPRLRRFNIRCPYPCKDCTRGKSSGLRCPAAGCRRWQDWFLWYWAELRRKYLKHGRTGSCR